MAPLSKKVMRRKAAYWVTTALLEVEPVLEGIWDIFQVPQVRSVVYRLGYPAYLLIILGIWKLLGAVALAIPRFPRLKEWTYVGVVFNFTRAIASHLASWLIDIGALVYLTAMLGVTVASWSLQTLSRRDPLTLEEP